MADWQGAFAAECAKSIPEQRDGFLNRFTLQLSKQGEDAKEIVKMVLAAADMFTEKAKVGGKDGKALQYGGVEFGDVFKEFCGEDLTFVQRKKTFSPFDLDNNGYIDLIEFLLYFYKKNILAGYKERNSQEEPENEAEALMKECVAPALFIDPKLDAAILGLKELKEAYEKSVADAKKEAEEGGGVKKVQLGGNLQKLEKTYEEDQKRFLSEDAIEKKKKKILVEQEKIVQEMKAVLEKEDADARGPSKKK